MIASGAFGKKVLFLLPPPVLTEIVEELARREFEVYLVRDLERARRFLAKEPECILFVNLDEGLDEEGWEGYVKGLRGGEETAAVGLGVLSMNDDPELKRRYLMDIQVQCGYITLKVGAAKTAEILIRTLEANEARGRRKFVRALCPPASAQCIIGLGVETLRAEVQDFSSAGFAMTLDTSSPFRPGSVLRGLQLSIKGARVIADGIVVAYRPYSVSVEDGGKTQPAHHIVMFDPASLDDAKREKLRSLVFKMNQSSLDRYLEAI